MKSFIKAAEAAATASGLPFDPTAETLRFCDEYVALKGFCDESGVARRLFDDWESNADVAEQEVLQSNDQYPRGLIGNVRLALHELHCLDDNDAASSRQLLSILALCPSVNTPWSLFLGHDGSCISKFQRPRPCDWLRGSGAHCGAAAAQRTCASGGRALQHAPAAAAGCATVGGRRSRRGCAAD
jgi:hypothetical protein